ncbi:MAG: hypothetical protein ACI84R_001806 [Candidatus Azotimanducaceae bacterium]|jgi:hypothetical protein
MREICFLAIDRSENYLCLQEKGRALCLIELGFLMWNVKAFPYMELDKNRWHSKLFGEPIILHFSV